MDHSMYSLDKVLAPLPNATRVMLEMAKQQEDKFKIPSVKHGLSMLGVGPMDYETMKANDHWPLNPNFKSYEHVPFEDPMAPKVSHEDFLNGVVAQYEDKANQSEAAQAEGSLDPTAPPATPADTTGSGEQDQGSSDEIQQMFLALDDGTLQGAERMVKSFNQIFDEYARRTGRNMQTDLFTLQPGRQRETEYTTLNPGAY